MKTSLVNDAPPQQAIDTAKAIIVHIMAATESWREQNLSGLDLRKAEKESLDHCARLIAPTTPTPPPAAPATTAMVIERLKEIKRGFTYRADTASNVSIARMNLADVETVQSAITHLTALSERCAALEEDKAKTISKTCEAIRAELKWVSAGEVHTWGFVAAFMDIIDRTEKEMLK